MDWSQFISLTSKDVDLSALEAPKDGEDVVNKEGGGLKEFLSILVNKDYLNNKTKEGKDINSNFKTSLIKQEDELNISNNDITRTNAIESSR